VFVIVWGLCLLLCGGCVYYCGCCVCYCVGVVFVIVWVLCLLLCLGCVFHYEISLLFGCSKLIMQFRIWLLRFEAGASSGVFCANFRLVL